MASSARAVLASPDSLLGGALPVLSAQGWRFPISATPAMTIVAPPDCQKEMSSAKGHQLREFVASGPSIPIMDASPALMRCS